MSDINILKSKIMKDKFYNLLINQRTQTLIETLNNYLNVHEMTIPAFSTLDDVLNEQFDKHIEILTNKQNIIIINELITAYYRWIEYKPQMGKKITAKILLTAWSIVSFPEFILDKKKEEIKNTDKYIFGVYSTANDFIKSLNMLIKNRTSDNFIKFISYLNMYSNSFGSFIEKDKIDKINELSNQWYELKKNINLIKDSDKYDIKNKNDCINEINKTRKQIEIFITRISPEFDINELYRMEELKDNITKMMSKAYRDKLYGDLINKEYEMMTELIDELKESFIILNKNLHDEIHENIDTELLIQQHQNNSLSYQDIINIGHYLVKLIHGLQSPARVDTTADQWSKIKELEFVNNELLLVEIILFIMDEIEEIKQNIITLQTLLSLGINPLVNNK